MVKRVLITGAGGFIGRPCLALLAERGYEVHAVARNVPQTAAEAHWHRADLLGAGAIRSLMGEVRPTHVLHLAWVTEPSRYRESEENFRWVEASLALLEEFRRNGGIRFVMAGSCAEYDWRHGSCSEAGTPLAPTSPYAVCKHSMQLMVKAYSDVTALSWAWGRIFFLYGPHERSERLVPSVIRAILSGEEARCTPGDQVRDYLHVEDAARAFVTLLDSQACGPFNIASGDPIRVNDLVRMIGEVCGRPDLIRPGALPARPNDPAALVGDITRMRTETGWEPHRGLREGLESTVRWWSEALGAGKGLGPCD